MEYCRRSSRRLGLSNDEHSCWISMLTGKKLAHLYVN